MDHNLKNFVNKLHEKRNLDDDIQLRTFLVQNKFYTFFTSCALSPCPTDCLSDFIETIKVMDDPQNDFDINNLDIFRCEQDDAGIKLNDIITRLRQIDHDKLNDYFIVIGNGLKHQHQITFPSVVVEGGRRPTKKMEKKYTREYMSEIVCGKLIASWCHFCKDLQGPWKKVIQMLQRDKSLVCVSKEVALGDVQDEQKQQNMLKSLTTELNAKQDIVVKGGYPTIFKLDPFNNVVYYEDGPRTVEGLYQFFTGKSLAQRRSVHTLRNTGSKRRAVTKRPWPRRSRRKF